LSSEFKLFQLVRLYPVNFYYSLFESVYFIVWEFFVSKTNRDGITCRGENTCVS